MSITRVKALAGIGALVASAGLSILAAPAANASDLNCDPHTYRHTAGGADCTGSGKWRLRLDCAYESDYVGPWINQRGGTVHQEGECSFKNRRTTVEIRK